MGASNFYNRNANNVYAVLMDYEDVVFDEDGNETEETQMVQCESWDYDNLIDYVTELMDEQKLFKAVDRVEFYNNRNYEATGIKSLASYKTFGNVEVEVLLTAVIRSGYYEGANLDWELNYYAGSGYDDILDLTYEFESQNENQGMAKIQKRNAEKWATKIGEQMVEELERIFTQVSKPLEVVARFSNGETFYKEVG
jgi:hypothetical protein